MNDLVEFLFARIADDAAVTWTLHPYACEPDCCAPAGWVGSQCRYCDAGPHYGGTVAAITEIAEEHAETIHQRSRVLAECSAKRAIVEHWQLASEEHELAARRDNVVATPRRAFRQGRDDAWWTAVHVIALPYASHPDFREEWRP